MRFSPVLCEAYVQLIFISKSFHKLSESQDVVVKEELITHSDILVRKMIENE